MLAGAVGEAFLGVLSTATKYQASNKDILAAYGRLYNALAATGSDSWQVTNGTDLTTINFTWLALCVGELLTDCV